MKKLFLLIFLVSCTMPNTNYNNDNIDINFNDDLTFDEFDKLLKKYSEKSIYPNINK